MYPTIPQIEIKICPRCRFEERTGHLLCPRCGRQLRNETQIRLFGAVITVFGLINVVTLGIFVVLLDRALNGIEAGEIEWRAAPGTILATMLVLKLLASLAAAATVGGLCQLLSGSQNLKIYFVLAAGGVFIWTGLTAADFFIR